VNRRRMTCSFRNSGDLMNSAISEGDIIRVYFLATMCYDVVAHDVQQRSRPIMNLLEMLLYGFALLIMNWTEE
jgi:hypothetical protein